MFSNTNKGVVFKLKSAINVDELIKLQNFEFRRKSTRNGVSHTYIIGCKIRDLFVLDLLCVNHF